MSHPDRVLHRRLMVLLAFALLLEFASATAYTVFSVSKSGSDAGVFYGPGKLPAVRLFDATIRNVGFSTPNVFITPFVNNGREGPFTAVQLAVSRTPDGTLSDNATLINVNVDTDPFELNKITMTAVIVGGGLHGGEQIAVMHRGAMIMTMDMALDMGIGEGGVIKLPFYGTTDEATIPYSLQTQMGLPGGIDRAGPLESGAKIKGRIGDINDDGFIDGAVVVVGNMPLTSVFMPGAPYALIRHFHTDMKVGGATIGKLPGDGRLREAERKKADFRFPEDQRKFMTVD